MRICVFGAGALGSAIGGILARRNEVFLIGRSPHVNAVREHGLVLEGNRRGTVGLDASETTAGLSPPDLVILTTKAYDTGDAVRQLRKWIPDETAVLTLQNGLGNLEALRAWKGSRAFGGTTTFGATMVSPGRVRISGLGRTVIGSDADPRTATILASAFSIAGIPTTSERDIVRALWSKATVSASINPVTAILRIPNGRLLNHRSILAFSLAVCDECVAVANSNGIMLGARSSRALVRKVARDTAKNLSSMLQDVLRGRRTEIGQINGAFCRVGCENGISTPLNGVLVALIEAIEAESRAQKG